jgi:hypothetical protein
MENDGHWVGTWATAPAPSESGLSLNNYTVRMNPRVSIGGDTVRIRVSNAFGREKLEIGSAYVGIRDQGPAVVPGSERRLTFDGSESTTVTCPARYSPSFKSPGGTRAKPITFRRREISRPN